MKLYKNHEALSFDDVLLVPRATTVETRRDIDLTMSIGYDAKKIELYLPVISAPMDTVCDQKMAVALAEYGALGIIHRFMDEQEQSQQVNAVAKKGHPVGAAVSLSSHNRSVLPRVESLVYSGARLILVDTANGHNEMTVNTVREIRRAFPTVHIMAGNVATWDGFLQLSLAGADSVRVGIGGGSMCTTRIVTGHGVPTLTSIMEIYEMLERIELPTSLIADGGIRNAGDAVKAFAAGAEAVMLGSVLAGHDESPGVLKNRNGKAVKEFRGMASERSQNIHNGKVSVVEGSSTFIPAKGPVGRTLDGIRGGIASGCSYSGVHTLSDLPLFSEYMRTSTLSLGESLPHGHNK